MEKNYYLKFSRGFMLIELLIALSIGNVLLGLLFSVYLTADKIYSQQKQLTQLQENASIIFKMLSQDIKSAGYMGCAKLSNHFPLVNSPPYFFSDAVSVVGWHQGSSDAITIRKAQSSQSSLLKDMVNNSILYLTPESAFKKGDILIISDCQHAELFQIKSVFLSRSYSRITTEHPLSSRYRIFADVNKFVERNYFIAKTQRYTSQGAPIFALYLSENHEKKIEVVPNIISMQLTFNVLTQDKLHITAIDETSDWSQVKGVNIHLKLENQGLVKDFYSSVALRERI